MEALRTIKQCREQWEDVKNAKNVDGRAFFISDLIQEHLMQHSEDPMELSCYPNGLGYGR